MYELIQYKDNPYTNHEWKVNMWKRSKDRIRVKSDGDYIRVNFDISMFPDLRNTFNTYYSFTIKSCNPQFLYKIECPCCKTIVKLGWDQYVNRQTYVMDHEHHSDDCPNTWRTYTQINHLVEPDTKLLQTRLNEAYIQYCVDSF